MCLDEGKIPLVRYTACLGRKYSDHSGLQHILEHWLVTVYLIYIIILAFQHNRDISLENNLLFTV